MRNRIPFVQTIQKHKATLCRVTRIILYEKCIWICENNLMVRLRLIGLKTI